MVGFGTNMISYLTTQLHMPLTQAANTLTNFGGTASLTPLIGAFTADAYAGRFWTITVASIIYQIVINTLSLSIDILTTTKHMKQIQVTFGFLSINLFVVNIKIYIYMQQRTIEQAVSTSS